jgi:spore maturation protein CgeB
VKLVYFTHSLASCWNHGNAHFLRGVLRELTLAGHEVVAYEPEGAWSLDNLLRDHGEAGLSAYRAAYPELASIAYGPNLDLDVALDGADVVIVHEWSDHDLVRRIGEHRARTRSYRLFFHDTHHRAATQPDQMAAYDLSHYDGVLAYGDIIRDLYLQRSWTREAWTWHEAADTRIFHPRPHGAASGDLVWIGNWGDDERTAELHEFLIDPAHDLKLRARVYGVRYPDDAVASLRRANIDYAGWLPNWRAPEVFSRYRFTVHVPRRPYVTTLRGIPTIRPFEAMACAIPLISSPWEDSEGLFTAGKDYLVAHNGKEMRKQMRAVLEDRALAHSLAEHGLATIAARHTCAHRVTELLTIIDSLGVPSRTTDNGQQTTAL